MEVQRPQRAVASRCGAVRLHVRGDFPPAHDRQGPQSRHRLVCDARQRMASAQGGVRALARARQFRRSTAARRRSLSELMPEADAMTPTIARKARPLRRIARGARLLRHAQPVRRRLGEISRFARLPGAGEHQRRHGLRGWKGPTARSTEPMRSSHIGDLADATDLPLNADFEAGFARDAEGVHESARLCIGAGVAGFSIEDLYRRSRRAPLRSQRSGRTGCARRARRSTPAARRCC